MMSNHVTGKNLGAKQSAGRAVAPGEVKLCELCGALNYQANAECFVCGWRGAFGREGDAVRLAWERLRGEYKLVTLEHVTGKKARALGELGVVAPTRGWHGLRASLAASWRTFLHNRDLRAAEREAALRPRRHTRPGGLGV